MDQHAADVDVRIPPRLHVGMNPTWHRQRLGRLTLAALSLAAAAPVLAETVQRCESADGKVTYSNTQCPAGTSATRKVNTSPPVAVDDENGGIARAAMRAEVKKPKGREGEQKAERTAAEQKSPGQALKCDRASTMSNAR
jgi:hypothetical protein